MRETIVNTTALSTPHLGTKVEPNNYFKAFDTHTRISTIILFNDTSIASRATALAELGRYRGDCVRRSTFRDCGFAGAGIVGSAG